MKILITGASGFVGKNLVLFLKNKGHTVFEYSRKLEDVKPDVIVHTAAELYLENRMFESNVTLTYELLEHYKNTEATFVYIGTSSEFGMCNSPIKETNPINPTTFYSTTKACGFLLCDGYKNKYKSMLILRPFSLYGPYEKATRFIPKLYNCYKNGDKMEIVKEATHDWLYIDDFIKGVYTAINKGASGAVNFGTGVETNNLEVYETFCSIVGQKITVKFIDQLNFFKPFDSLIWECDTSYAERYLGFKSEISLFEGLKKYVSFMEAV